MAHSATWSADAGGAQWDLAGKAICTIWHFFYLTKLIPFLTFLVRFGGQCQASLVEAKKVRLSNYVSNSGKFQLSEIRK